MPCRVRIKVRIHGCDVVAHRAITLERDEAVIAIRGEDERLPRPRPIAGPAAAPGLGYRALLVIGLSYRQETQDLDIFPDG